MISRLRGIILEKKPPIVLLEVNGIGYEIYMPKNCFHELLENGREMNIFTHLLIRENTYMLFGFINELNRTLFRELIKVNGIGSKLALEILSGMSAQQFVNAIDRKELDFLLKLPGIGKKTAERLILEMQDCFKRMYKKDLLPSPDTELKFKASAEAEAVIALVSLGYKSQEAELMIKRVSRKGLSNKQLIRTALQAINKDFNYD